VLEMLISVEEKTKRAKAVKFVKNNSRLEGLEYTIPEVDDLYLDYITGIIDLDELGEKTSIIMDRRLIASVS
jgi:hypothetical protein